MKNLRTYDTNTRIEHRIVGEGMYAINDRAEVLIQSGILIPEFIKFAGLCLEYMQNVIRCYAQALGVVGVGSLLVELSGKVRVRSGRPSCRASQGQNHGVWRGCKGSGEVRQSA